MNEYAVLKNDEGELEAVVVLDDDGVMGVTLSQDTATNWGDYFRTSSAWENTHMYEEHPLQSVFRSPYMNVDFKDIDGSTYGDDVYDLIDKLEEIGDIYVFHVPIA